jgi:hypothetical protein
VSSGIDNAVGFAPEEVAQVSTREARLKWVVVVDDTVPAWRVANAIACVAAATGDAVSGLIGPNCPDASGHDHHGLPWIGCAILRATPARLAEIREKAVAGAGVLVAEMPALAQATRVYDEYMAELAETKPADLATCAISVVGPRNRVAKLVKGLELLS